MVLWQRRANTLENVIEPKHRSLASQVSNGSREEEQEEDSQEKAMHIVTYVTKYLLFIRTDVPDNRVYESVVNKLRQHADENENRNEAK